MLGGLLHQGARALTATLPSQTVVDREASRTRLLFAGLGVVAVTLAVPGTVTHDPVALVAAVLLALATAIASTVRSFWPALNRFGGVLMAAQITLLVTATGGSTSPFGVLYGFLLVYAAMFYPLRRLVAIAIVLFALYLAPHALSVGDHAEHHWSAVVSDVGVWGVVTAVVHGLMAQMRVRAAERDESEQRYRALFDHNPDSVFSLDLQGRITAINAAGADLVCLSPADVVGKTYEEFVSGDDLDRAVEMFGEVLTGHGASGLLTVVRGDGSRIVGAVTTFPVVVDAAVVGAHVVLKDVTEIKALQDQLAHQALHDPLTGVANRRLLDDRLEQHHAQTLRSGSPFAALVIDLDRFKAVNDTRGHAAGDQVLVDVAARISTVLRKQDTLARLGGDEFAVLLPDADQRVARHVAERIRDAVDPPIVLDGGQQVQLTASIGFALSTDGVDGLLERADTSMYADKGNLTPSGDTS